MQFWEEKYKEEKKIETDLKKGSNKNEIANDDIKNK